MATYDYDVLYIGSGHGTFDGAIPLAAKGVHVGIIEADLIGGTCPNRGCNAKITLDAPVELQRRAEALSGIVTGQLGIDWSQNMAHKHQVIDDLPNFINGLLESVGIKVLHGYGQLVDAHTVAVGDQQVTADKIVIATGLRPHRLDIPGTDLAHDSSDFMNLTELPANITIIGAGYIAMEFATIANAAGAKVTMIMRGDKALRRYHQPFVEAIISDLEKRGVRFMRHTQVTAIEQADSQLHVVTDQDETLTTDWVLDATGRIPNIENLGLEKVGVVTTEHGIKVNSHLRTTVDNIYASGDVLDKKQPRLTPTAIFESMYLSRKFAGESDAPIDYPAIPSVVFTSPQIAKVGVSVEAAEKDGLTIEKHDVLDDWYRHVNKERFGQNALIFDQGHHLVGATEVSDRADDVINTLLPAIALKLDKEQIGRIVTLFPTIGSSAWGQL